MEIAACTTVGALESGVAATIKSTAVESTAKAVGAIKPGRKARVLLL